MNRLLCMLAITAALGFTCLRPAAAQSYQVRYDPIGKTVNLDADNADVRQVTRELLRVSGITKYKIEDNVEARITLKLRNVTTENALKTALARGGADYSLRDGVVRVYRVANNPTAPAYSECRRCRYGLQREWRFCPMCGARIERQ